MTQVFTSIHCLPTVREALGSEADDFDLSEGNIIHGPVKVYAPSLFRTWRKHYAIVNRPHEGVFIWEGTRPDLWSNPRKLDSVRCLLFTNFRGVTWYPDTHGGHCFDVDLMSGPSISFMGYNSSDALEWAKTFSKVGAETMAACRLQRIARGWRARVAYRRLKAVRAAALQAVRDSHARDAGGAYTIDLEGPLRQRVASVVGSLWKQCYVELASGRGELTVFPGKTRKTSYAIPFEEFLKIEWDEGAAGKRAMEFAIVCRGGQATLFLAKTPAMAREWVQALQRVLPRENIAAIRIQRAFRRARTYRAFRGLVEKMKSRGPAPAPRRRSLILRMARKSTATSAAASDGALQSTARSRMDRLRELRERRRRAAGGEDFTEPVRGWVLRETGASRQWRRRFAMLVPGVPVLLLFRGEEDAARFEAASGGEGSAEEVEAADGLVMGQVELEGVVAAGASQRTDLPAHAAGAVDIATNERCHTLAVEAEEEAAGQAVADAKAKAAREGAPPPPGPTRASTVARWIAALGRGLDACGAQREGLVAAARDAENPWVEVRGPAGAPVVLVHKFSLERRAVEGAAVEAVEWEEVEVADPMWVQYTDSRSGKPYFMNKDTKEVTWTKPAPKRVRRRRATGAAAAAAGVRSSAASALPEGWREAADPTTGRAFFVHTVSGARQWERPVVEGAEAAKDAPAAAAAVATVAAVAAVAATSEASNGAEAGAAADAGGVSVATVTQAASAEGRAEAAPVAPAPTAWRAVHHAESGRDYYYNQETKERTWTKPEALTAYETAVRQHAVALAAYEARRTAGSAPSSATPAAVALVLSDAEREAALQWRAVMHAESGREYYYNTATKERSWTKPANFDLAKQEAERIAQVAKAAQATSAAEVAKRTPAAEASQTVTKAQPLQEASKSHVVASSEPNQAKAPLRTVAPSPAETAADSGPREPASPDQVVVVETPASPVVGASEAKILAQEKALNDPLSQLPEQEVFAVAQLLNFVLARGNSTHLEPYMPLLVGDDLASLFKNLEDGVVLCTGINGAVPDTVDERVLNVLRAGDGALDESEISKKCHENRSLCLDAASAIGCVLPTGFIPEDFARPSKPFFELIWQITHAAVCSSVSLRKRRELAVLVDESEGVTKASLLRMSPRVLLMRWVNMHLLNADADPISSVVGLLKSPALLCSLVRQICVEESVLEADAADAEAVAFEEGEGDDAMAERALARVVELATLLGVPNVLRVEDLQSCSDNIGLAFLALLFDTAPGIRRDVGDAVEVDELEALEADNRGSVMFQMWINSLHVPGLVVRDIVESAQDGISLLKVMDAVQPGIVDWGRVNSKPNNKWRKLENLKKALELCTVDMEMQLVNIGAVDILNGNQKLISSLMWQMMRRHLLEVLNSLASGDSSEAFEEDIIHWANEEVIQSAPPRARPALRKRRQMRSFGDNLLQDSVFFAQLLDVVAPGRIDWGIVEDGTTEDEKVKNARYVISVARKIGCTVFVSTEDLVKSRSKMVMTFVASIMAFARQQAESADVEGYEDGDAEAVGSSTEGIAGVGEE